VEDRTVLPLLPKHSQGKGGARTVKDWGKVTSKTRPQKTRTIPSSRPKGAAAFCGLREKIYKEGVISGELDSRRKCPPFMSHGGQLRRKRKGALCKWGHGVTQGLTVKFRRKETRGRTAKRPSAKGAPQNLRARGCYQLPIGEGAGNTNDVNRGGGTAGPAGSVAYGA